MWNNSKSLLQTGVSLFCLCFASLSWSAPADWQKIKRPVPVEGKALAIGKYTNGCIIGAQPLPFKGTGFQTIRIIKNRFYGHPNMIAYLKHLGQRVHQAHLPDMLVGDIAMPAGGRFLTGHRSHQMGLDADIWFRMGKMSKKEAYNPAGMAVLMVDRKTKKVIDEVWSKNQEQLLKLAASDNQVARIFVNPAIKIKLCETVKGDRHWLHKIRPWFGHDAHFHIRLHCPKDAQYCTEQAPIPKGDGCDATLYSWLKPAPKKTGPSKPVVIPPPPPLCQQILTAPNRSEWFE